MDRLKRPCSVGRLRKRQHSTQMRSSRLRCKTVPSLELGDEIALRCDRGCKETHEAMEELKVLFLGANPDGTTKLNLDVEVREITDKVRASEHRDAVDLVSRWAVRPDDLLQYLNQDKPHVVHFSGHGTRSEEILLLDKNGTPKAVSKEALEGLFRTLKDNIRVVVLSACFSRHQAEPISSSIDCTIGMNKAIGDDDAITFAGSFYRALGFGRSVKDAFEQACAALLLEGIGEETTPELLVRPGVDASKVVLVNPR